MGLLIVGGGPAGLACARGYRDAGGSAPVLMISADQYPPYNRPPLTKDYLRGESAADTLPLVDADWYAQHDVGLVLDTRVTRIDRDARQVITAAGTRWRTTSWCWRPDRGRPYFPWKAQTTPA
ncbi:hypothetical protein GCM10027613_07620 [Microlunatus endophyticus]